MLRCSRREKRRPPSCSCLVEAFRSYPAQTDVGQGCATPDCPVRSLDTITLHQFLEAIGRPEGLSDDEIEQAGQDEDSPIARAMARRRSSDLA